MQDDTWQDIKTLPHGVSRQDNTRPARQHKAMPDKTTQGNARQDNTRLARQHKAMPDKTTQGNARQDSTR